MFDISLLGNIFTQIANQFLYEWGYIGVFIISIIGNATIILPLPTFAFVFAAGFVLNPWLVGFLAGLGSAIGEFTGYVLGRGGSKLTEKRYKKDLLKIKKWIEKHGMFPVLVLFAATPLPDDIVGLLCGFIRYDIKRFFLATFLGKTLLHLAIAWAGFYGGWITSGVGTTFTWIVLIIAGAVVYSLVSSYRRRSNPSFSS
ncbi:MAG: hypothetical protein DRP15_01265 [Candidatus Aenigmatarchaeota archaeon]|nr:MAG: hypothetical protein DRP15_01265 [Candidatus Aenigmarchaeota archaeon]